MKPHLGLGLVTLALVGCGDLGATEVELGKARREGERIGKTKARAADSTRIQEARKNARWAGRDEGWDEGWDAAVETVEEEEEEEELDSAYEDEFDPTPEKLDGTDSYEFEGDDIERAEEAPPEVREYCEGEVSEAQELGCLSHVEPWEVP